MRRRGLRPAFRALFEAAAASGAVESDLGADDVLDAAARLCASADPSRPGHARRLVALLVGLRRPEGTRAR